MVEQYTEEEKILEEEKTACKKAPDRMFALL